MYVFLDIAKAFDKVDRQILLDRLWNIGIRGKMWRILKNLLKQFKGRIRISDLLTEKFNIDLGVVQGSRLGPLLYNIFLDDFVRELNKQPGIITSDGIPITTLGYADDLLLLNNTHAGMQNLLQFCATYATDNNFTFSATKCKALVYHTPYNTLEPLYISGTKLEYIVQYTYLGVCFNKGKLSFKPYFDKLLHKAVQRGAGIRQFGYSVNGLRPKSGLKLYCALIRPIFEYGSQVLNPPKSFIKGSRACQSQNIKLLLGLEKGTSTACVRLLSGIPPLSARFDFFKIIPLFTTFK